MLHQAMPHALLQHLRSDGGAFVCRHWRFCLA
jgi:hypothetical protein